MSELTFEKIETGRTHQIGGEYQPILDANGDAETEYALCAIVDGHRVTLQTFSVGYVEHMVGRDDTAVDSSSSSSSAPADATDQQPAQAEAGSSPAAGEGTAGEGAAAGQQPPAAPTS